MQLAMTSQKDMPRPCVNRGFVTRANLFNKTLYEGKLDSYCESLVKRIFVRRFRVVEFPVCPPW